MVMIKVLVSEMGGMHPLEQLICEHVIFRMRNPDPGSPFDQANKILHGMPDMQALKSLLAAGYEGILRIGTREPKVVGDTYFQPQNKSTELICSRGMCIVTTVVSVSAELLCRDFLEYAWEHRFRIIRLSAGGEKSRPLLHVLDGAIEGYITFPDFHVASIEREGSGWAGLVA